MSSDQNNPELPPWLDASADDGENPLDSGGHQVHTEDRVARHAPHPHEGSSPVDAAPPQRSHSPPRQLPRTQPKPERLRQTEAGSRSPPQEARQSKPQPTTPDPLDHIRSVHAESETAQRSPSSTRHVDSTLNQEAPVAHPQPVPPGPSRVANVRVVSPSNLPPASSQPVPPRPLRRVRPTPQSNQLRHGIRRRQRFLLKAPASTLKDLAALVDTTPRPRRLKNRVLTPRSISSR